MQPDKILIYTPCYSSRFEYIAEVMLQNLLGLEYKITHSKTEYSTTDLPKINYSDTPLNSGLYLLSHSILFSDIIEEQKTENLKTISYKSVPVFFHTDKNSFLPFDVFAAGFYLLSRYEEYLPFKADKYNRFPANQSFAFKNKCLDKPLVNIYADMLCNELQSYYPFLAVKKQEFQYYPTIDIDNAFAFKHKGFYRTTGALAKALINCNFSNMYERTKCLLNISDDMFNTYTFIEKIHSKSVIKPCWFFLIGDYAKHDTNLHFRNKHFRKLIRDIAKKNDVGIHPSFASNVSGNEEKQLKKIITEKKRLEEILKRPVTKSRQHFLMLKIPDTYRILLKAGISRDYSMGYASSVGFRAGICSPFPFFDLKANQQTNLTVYPFAVMDVTLKDYMKMQPKDATNKTEKLIAITKQYNGMFMSLWHNESLCNTKTWINWQHVYSEIMETACALQGK